MYQCTCITYQEANERFAYQRDSYGEATLHPAAESPSACVDDIEEIHGFEAVNDGILELSAFEILQEAIKEEVLTSSKHIPQDVCDYYPQSGVFNQQL